VHVRGSSFVADDHAPILVGESVPMQALRDAIVHAARTQAKVLIEGETGSGKELVARSIHAQSARRTGPLIAVNCSGVPESLLESELFGHTRGSFTGAIRDSQGLLRQAHGGTLFLDELGEMSARMQAVLLRFTETGEIQQVGAERPTARADVRLICATNRDLRQQISAGLFREDLYYRVNVIQIHVPPLRERAEDIPTLLRHFLMQAAVAHRLDVPELTPAFADALMAYRWPGNVRELRNIAERLILSEPGAALHPHHLPSEILDRSNAASLAVSAVTRAVELHDVPHVASDAPAAIHPFPASDDRNHDRVAHLWALMEAGADFWTVVYGAFKARELTRSELAAIIDRGLHATAGSYTALLAKFNMPASDYKRFHAFLYQQQCNLPVSAYRHRKPRHVPGRGDAIRAQVA
jgi:DNA-binding NtrC family response regulator